MSVCDPLDPLEEREPTSARSTPAGPLAWEKDPHDPDWETKTLVYRHYPSVAAKIGKIGNTDPGSGEFNVRSEMIPWDEPDGDTGYPPQVIPGVTNPVMFHHPTVPDHLLTVSEVVDKPQLLRRAEPAPEKPVGYGTTTEDQHDLRPDPTMVDMEAFWDDLSMDAQATIKRVITRHVADRDGDVVAQWLTRPAMLAEMAALGIQQVLRMASDVPDDEPMIASGFADTPDDIRSRLRQRRWEQQAAWARFDQAQRESVARVAGINHAALASDPGAVALVDYQLPGGGPFAVTITGQGFGWAVPLTASEVETLPWPSVDELEPVLFSPVDDAVTLVMDNREADWLRTVHDELDFPVYHGSFKTAWANADPMGIEVDIELQPFNQPVLLATVIDGNRTTTLAYTVPMAIPQRVESGACAVRGPPVRRRDVGSIGARIALRKPDLR